ncbi:uncharacterized protein LOC116352668 [Contarinia nasturtii]|uniref:uncharacterized protein LOC116352668 n=1 Tax=Contarinia nasturtii TaxID=265458 RepID=UPI0012D49C48|nr:uncharacterized protein LOC116352668 [Contarinia nasturtii]
MKSLLFLVFVSLAISNQFESVIGGYDYSSPAFTTLVYSFALKAKVVDNTINWENILMKFFSLPDDLLQNNKIDSLEWYAPFCNATNFAELSSAVNRIPREIRTNGPILDIIRSNLEPVRDADAKIKQIYVQFFNKTIVDPICLRLDGFITALDKFNSKKLKFSRLKAVNEEYTNMVRKYDEIVRNLRGQLDNAIIKRRAYAKQFQLLQQKLNRYEPPQGRSEANKQNEEYDFDYLKMLQAVSKDLNEKMNSLENAVNAVVLAVNQYIDQRILWAEFLLNIPFYHAPQKKSSFSCFGGSKIKK